MSKLCFRRTSSNIQIKEATTIAAYVAYTHKPLRTNEVLGVRNGKVHFVLKLVISRLVKLTQAFFLIKLKLASKLSAKLTYYLLFVPECK